MKSIKKRTSRRKRSGTDTRKVARQLFLAIAIFFAVAAGAFLFRKQSGLPLFKPVRMIPPYYDNAARAKPFPKTVSPSLFRQPVIVRAYSVAEAIPDLLVQQPCFCGCAASGHKSLLSCFVSEHAASSRVCLKEALLVERLHRNGYNAAYIRTSIIAGDWWNEKVE